MPYVLGSGVPYGQYLQAQALVDDVKGALARERKQVSLAVQSSTREIVASQDGLRDQGIRLEQATQHGFEQLSWDLQEVRGAVEDLNATFEWGFNAILCHTGRMADALEALLAAVKTPTKTRAYEYFDDARTAFSRGHHRDALDLINKAIAGDHTSAGYKLEWRFHLLKGSILVGTTAHPELLDLSAAEQTYRTAAEYAETEEPRGASLALLGASWACYCQGKLDEALALAKRALHFCPRFGEALFQSAKILMAMARPLEALPLLAAALDEDPQYLLKACGDGDFQAHNASLEAWLNKHRERKEDELRTVYSQLSEDGRFWLRCVAISLDLGAVEATLLRTKPGLFDLLCALRTLRSIVPTNTSPPQSAADAVNVVKAVPPRLPLPRQLLSTFVAQSRGWGQDAAFFEFVDVLLKRSEHETLRALFNNSPRSPDTPLEFFVAWHNALPTDSTAARALNDMLKQKAADARGCLVYQLETVHRSRRYSQDSIKRTKAALLARWEEWRPAIRRELKERAFAGTESPGKGAIGRFFGSFFGCMIPALIVEQIAGPGIAMLSWIGGVGAVVFVPVAKRSSVRHEKLRTAHESEETLYDRLRQIDTA
jgi:tetratricopeptide (TPR) repeat protein